MREAQFGLIAMLRDLKDNVRAGPLALVRHKVELGILRMPDNFLILHEFGNLVCAAMHVPVAISELIAKFVRATFNSRLAGPPGACVIDGSEYFCRGLVYENGCGVILFVHCIGLLFLFTECLFTLSDGFADVGIAFPCRNQAAQTAFDISAPSADMVDGSEDFLRTLVYRKGGGVILVIHDFLLV